MIDFNWYHFSELTTQQLYAVLILRSKVFVVEQNCVYLDPDGNDTQAIHLLGSEHGVVTAYLRLFPPTKQEPYLILGRVVIKQSVRAKGYGRKLMQELLSYCDTHYPGIGIKGSAQHYLVIFYEGFGFKTFGTVYEEDGILHIEMRRT